MENFIESSRTGHDPGDRICEKIQKTSWSLPAVEGVVRKLDQEERGIGPKRSRRDNGDHRKRPGDVDLVNGASAKRSGYSY